jgi:hypothetical protein
MARSDWHAMIWQAAIWDAARLRATAGIKLLAAPQVRLGHWGTRGLIALAAAMSAFPSRISPILSFATPRL